MNLSKDRIIHIALTSIIVILTGVILTMVIGNDEEEATPQSPWIIENEETTEETIEMENLPSEEVEEKKTTVIKNTTISAPKTSTPKETVKPTQGTSATGKSVCTPNLTAKKSSTYKGVLLNWTACKNDDFQFYKVVRSTTNANPIYPGSNVVTSSGNRSVTNYIDKVVASSNTYYYRVCAVHRFNRVTCGSKAVVSY